MRNLNNLCRRKPGTLRRYLMARPKSTRGAQYFDTGYLLLSPVQVKMARAALGLGIRELAELAECAPSTVMRFEGGKGGMHVDTLQRIQKTLEREGVVFIDADEKLGPGVRMRGKRS
ncbi:MAG: helix-turn-helix transcriptional regulator [Hyphomonadaceae bacterium]